MASACVNNIGVSPENFPSSTFPAYGWLSPRISFSHEFSDKESEKKLPNVRDTSDPAKDHADFEFRLHDPVTMLPADELFSNGKLVPLQLTVTRPAKTATSDRLSSPEAMKSSSRSVIVDPYLQSPKAPRCYSHWRELLRFRKNKKVTSSSNSSSPPNTGKSIRHIIHRASKSISSDSESITISSSRLSLSSSSSGHDHDDLPRLSLDSDNKPHRIRKLKPRSIPTTVMENRKPSITRQVTAHSPRMSSSGKIVFLERSCSSPSSFNGGPRYRHIGMERSYSANVRITPVLNVPVCSLRGSSKSFGFGQFFSSPSMKKENSDGNITNKSLHHHQHCNNRFGTR